MARPSIASRRHRGGPERSFADRLQQLLDTAPVDQPLPTTRELGERFSVANTTVFRLLRDLASTGTVWQHPVNGRYYPAAARALFDRPKPVACLFRRLELGSQLYRELLEGVSAGCGAHQRMMSLWHDELLLNHPDPQEPPVFASVAQQRIILHNFISRHGSGAGGFVLDHAWSDEALAAEKEALTPAVILYRTSSLPGVSNIRADLRSGAFKALAHLLGRGFDQIIPVVPFQGDLAIDEFGSVLDSVATELDCRACLAAPAAASRATDRAALLKSVKRSKRRSALLVPEDNVAIMLLNAGRAEGMTSPKDFGVLAVMGTDIAVRSGLSCLRYDFRRLGRLAVDALSSPAPVHMTLEPSLVAASST
ncbi:MAG TPA: substrate-binding domain-containing protein [Opitutaceae bacterium]|nr:substrate-binding domain-containing protein [Opitutaceae bacterium]